MDLTWLKMPQSTSTVSQRSRKVLGIVLMPVISLLWVTQSGLAQWIFGNVPEVDSFTMAYAGYVTRCVLLLNYLRPAWRSSPSSSTSSTSVMVNSRTLRKTVILCAPLGFLGNWAYYAGLSRSTLASSSTLSSTATLFALIILSLTHFKIPKLTQVVASFLTVMGVAFIFIHDSSSTVSLSFQFTMYGKTVMFGDLLTLVASFFSGAYSVVVQATFVQWCGENANADQFVALNGVFIFVAMLPVLIYKLNSLPSGLVLLQLCVNAFFGEVVNGMIWTRCTKWVSPLITSLTSTLLVPMSVLWDLVAGGRTFRYMYVLGTSLIIFAFVLLCYDDDYNSGAATQNERDDDCPHINAENDDETDHGNHSGRSQDHCCVDVNETSRLLLHDTGGHFVEEP